MNEPMPHRPQVKLALWLGAASVFARLALFPYLIQLLPQAYASVRQPLWLVVSLSSLQTGLLCFLLAWLGLYLGAPLGLDAPWLRAWVYRRPLQGAAPARWRWAALLGLLAGAVVVGVSMLWPEPAVGPVRSMGAVGQAWRGALAALYGGVTEELLCRLLLMTLLVWLLSRLHHGQARTWMYVAAMLLAGLLFGLSHGPAAVAVGMHTPLQLTRIVLLNSVVGCVSGWLFWKRGLEHAMLAHFSADLVLHVIAPLGFS